jgi:hypothetical protein
MTDYEDFLREKAQIDTRDGFAPIWIPDCAFDFQAAMIEWACWQGRGALLEDCGLGKTLQELVWAENVVRKTNGNVLVKTPMAVSKQVKAEADKFGIEVHVSRDGKLRRGINVTNYERLHLFSPNDFVGTVDDESSILKNFAGARRAEITEFDRRMRYRLHGTATAAPNDYTELGTSSESLGYLGYIDMLNRFFKNDLNNSSTGRGFMGSENKWRFKGHAEEPFWRWVCSWARAIRRPSDLGFDDAKFVLPPLREVEHLVSANTLGDGMLFAMPAVGLQEQRDERRRTITERCEKVAQLVQGRDRSVSWCQLNDEGDLLETLIPGARQIKGTQCEEEREEIYDAFLSGEVTKLVIKDSIGAFGLNWQHCAHTTLFPSHSYERYYQCIRRFYRFGQERPVDVDIVGTEGDSGVLKNQQRKAAKADEMFSALVAHMNAAMAIERAQVFAQPQELPAWL